MHPAKLRERLIAEIRTLRSPEEAAKWIRQSPQEKNRLRAFDAAQVKAVFGAKLAQLTALWAVAAEAQGIAAIKWPAFPDPEEDLSSNQSRNSSPRKPSTRVS